MRYLNMLWLAGVLICVAGAPPTPQQQNLPTGRDFAGPSEASYAPLDEREQLAEASVNIGPVATWYVDDDSCPEPGSGTEVDPFCLIQDCIDAAMDGDECVVAPGTYFENINFLGKAITLRSSEGAEVTTIDAADSGTVVTCLSGEGPDTMLDGFTVTGGTSGMFNFNSSPTVNNCTFSSNSANPFGGGMNNTSSNPTVTNCIFSGNSASGEGGGMFNGSTSSPTVTNCTFSGNTAGTVGGGMSNRSNSSPTVTNCTFSGNTASIIGGGMFNRSNSSPTVTNCTFSGNTAGTNGGGMNNESSNPTVTNCTFSGNTAGNNGGGMSNVVVSNPIVTNSIFWQNSDAGGMDASAQVYDNPSSGSTVNYSDVQGGFPGEGNIDADPLVIDPAGGDLRLLPDSPCIDAGDNDAVPADEQDLDDDGDTKEALPFDLDGNPRFVDGDGDSIVVVDMGAYEFQSPCEADEDCDDDNTCTEDSCDLDTGLCVYEEIPECCVPQCESDGDPCNGEEVCVNGACEPVEFPDCGACCDGELCDVMAEDDCVASGDDYQGDGSSCDPDPCALEESTCCTPHPEPGCDDQACEDLVCGVDPFCCDTAWDGTCVTEAIEMCGTLCPTDVENDRCEDALPIFDGDTEFDNTEATTDGPGHGGGICKFDGQTYQDLWYDYSATCTGELTVSTCDQADYDTDLVVYDGCDCPVSTDNLLGCNDDGFGCTLFTSELTVPVIEGNCYKVRIGGFNVGDVGTGTVTISCTSECVVDADCEDGNSCTDDICTGGTCEHTTNTDACDDGNACTEDDSCVNGACAGTPVDCTAQNDQCNVGACDPDTGECEAQPASEGEACHDGDPCTTCDACTNGTCAGEPAVCPKGQICDGGTCVPDVDACACVDGKVTICHIPPGFPDNRRTITVGCRALKAHLNHGDFCGPCEDAALECAADLDCDDGNLCTLESCDPEVGCEYQVICCDDGDACTIDSCDAGTGCVNELVDCDDDNVCTIDSCDAAAGCANELISCDDEDPCTFDTCDPVLGCVHTPIEPCCGNDVVEEDEQCDGTDDKACPGQCRPDCACEAEGACCSGTEVCSITTQADCIDSGGQYVGDGSSCDPDACEESTCCTLHGEPGCDIQSCEDLVCGVDPFCCDTEWDGTCVTEAIEMCGTLCPTSVENDRCEDALPIFDGDTEFDNTEATTDGPGHGGGICKFDGQTYQDLWYDYSATCTGELTVTTCDQADYDTDLVVYDGCDCPVSTDNLLGCNDDGIGCTLFTSELMVPVVEGNCYKVRIGGFSVGDVGTGTVTLSCGP